VLEVRRGAVTAREGQIGRFTAVQSKYYRLYLHTGKLALAAALAHLSIDDTPPAPAAQNLGGGFQRPCRGQAFSGMLESMARIAPARPATQRLTTT
jgi:hypothetical protein